jgi:predicted dehydrogenase
VQHVTGDPVVAVFADLGTLHPTRVRAGADHATFASGARAGGERQAVETEDYGSVLLRFLSGARGAFTVSQTSAGRKNDLSFQIDAAHAAFAWNQEHPDHAWVGRRSGANLELVRDPATATLSSLPPGHAEGWSDALRNLFADFYANVAAHRAGKGRESDVASFRDGHARVQLVEAVVTSHREQRWAAVQSPTEVPA